MNANLMRKAAKTGSSGMKRYSREVFEAFRAAARPQPTYPGNLQAIDRLVSLDRTRLGAMWIGHATMLLRIGGVNVLTDPVMGERIGVSLDLARVGLARRAITFGLSRLQDPGVGIDSLPKIDVVLLSHAHFDHLDRPTLARLAAGPAQGATVITARSTTGLIPQSNNRDKGFARIIELGWNDTFDLEARSGTDDSCGPTQRLRIRSIRPRHWGARTAVDHHRGCNAYVIESRSHRALFGGDTAYTEAFKDVGPCDLAMLGIGAYEPWSEAHATPEQAWSMFQDVSTGFGYGRLAPMHHSTFRLGDEPTHEPLDRLLIASGGQTIAAHPSARNPSSRVVCQSVGEVWADVSIDPAHDSRSLARKRIAPEPLLHTA